jgi:AraC-like DNA-binding protein
MSQSQPALAGAAPAGARGPRRRRATAIYGHRFGADAQAEIESLQALRRARDRIDRDYAEPIDIATLAAQAGYSPWHFIHAFRSAYGETPRHSRTRRRVERACELLRSVNHSVTEICLLVGFTSLGSFSARFSTVVGHSPSAYRRVARRSGGPAPIPACFALHWRAGLPRSALATAVDTILEKQ